MVLGIWRYGICVATRGPTDGLKLHATLLDTLEATILGTFILRLRLKR